MKSAQQRMVITDLDGTLLHSDRTISTGNLATLNSLGRQQVLRVIATGRSLYSARKVIPVSFPLDYLIFSSGAGIMDWRTQCLLCTHDLSASEILLATQFFLETEIDFMLHQQIPDNHHFWYHTAGNHNPDFVRRCQLYQIFSTPLQYASSETLPEKACQFVGILPKQEKFIQYEHAKTSLRTLKVIRATSPLDGQSLWIEIFPKTVSKSLAGAWLASQHNINHAEILALGNDYNDLDLLRWAGTSIVVSSAPPDLTQCYCTVGTNDEDGFSQAIKIWINN